MAGRQSPEFYNVPTKRQRIEGGNNDGAKTEKQRGGAKIGTESERGANLPAGEVADDIAETEENMYGEFKLENTVIVNVEGSEISIDELLDSIEDLCGNETVMGCVPCEGNVFEVTMINKDCSELLIPSLKIGDIEVSASSMSDTSTFVSIVHLPTYVTDDELSDKMKSFNIQIVSPIYRRYHKRKRSKRRIANGTRYFRVKFPEGIKSLPWSLAFKVRGTTRYFMTVHENQSKVCFKCCSDNHLARDCNLITCYTCFLTGHISVNCPKKWCSDCGKKKTDCGCESDADGNDSDSVTISEYEDDSELEEEESSMTKNNKDKQEEQEAEEKKKEIVNAQPAGKQDIHKKKNHKTETITPTKTNEKTDEDMDVTIGATILRKGPQADIEHIERKKMQTVSRKKQEAREEVVEEPVKQKATDRCEKKGDYNSKNDVKNRPDEKKERRPKMKFKPNLKCARNNDANINQEDSE